MMKMVHESVMADKQQAAAKESQMTEIANRPPEPAATEQLTAG